MTGIEDKKNYFQIIAVVNGEKAIIESSWETAEELANWLLGEDGMAGFIRGTDVRRILMPHFTG